MAKKDTNKTPENQKKANSAGKGIFPQIIATAIVIVAVAIALSVLCDLNVGRTPEIFGYELSFLV